jgi:hypothetical protein
MVKEFKKKEDKGEGTSSRVDEIILSIFDHDKTCLFPDF